MDPRQNEASHNRTELIRFVFWADARSMKLRQKAAFLLAVVAVPLAVEAGVGSDFTLMKSHGDPDAFASTEEISPGQSPGRALTPAPVADEGGRVGLSRYTSSEEAGIPEKGSLAIEQGLAFSHRIKSDHSFAQYDGATQVTYGLFEGVELSLAGAYSYIGSAESDSMQFDGVGAQVLIGIVDPAESSVGFSLYQGLFVGDEFFSTDTRLVFGVDRGPWNLTYNLGLYHDFGNTSWFGSEGPSIETAVTLGHTFGVSRSFECDRFFHEMSFGLELTVDSTWEDYKNYAGTTVYLGPTLGVTFCEHWSFTVSAYTQLTDEEDTPRWAIVTSLIYSF